MTNREASIFACFADIVVSPEPLLPPVRDTDAVAFFAKWLDLAPKLNAAGLRAAVAALEMGPLALGYRRRLRKLPRAQRVDYLLALERHRAPPAPVPITQASALRMRSPVILLPSSMRAPGGGCGIAVPSP